MRHTLPIPAALQGDYHAKHWYDLARQWQVRHRALDPKKRALYVARDGHTREDDTLLDGKAAEYLVQTLLNKAGLPYNGADVVLPSEDVRYESFDLTAPGYLPIEVKSTTNSLVYACQMRDQKFHPGEYDRQCAGLFVGVICEAETMRVEFIAHMWAMAAEAPEYAINYGSGAIMQTKLRLNALHVVLEHPAALVASLEAFSGEYVSPVRRHSHYYHVMRERKRRWERLVNHMSHLD